MAAASIDDRLAVWISTHRYAPLDDPFVWLGTIGKLGLVWAAVALVVGVATGRGLRGSVLLALLTGLAAFAADSASLGVTAVGLLCYALFCFVDARYRDVSSGGSGAKGARGGSQRKRSAVAF